jgi:tRNA-2-methylthio-N6-dimethylallyladenosine synthase
MEKTMKKYYIKTFGCQMNIYDSNVISETLENIGYKKTLDIEKSDLVIFNTCAIRDNAEHKALSELGAVRKIKKHKPDLIVGIIGCVAQKLGAQIIHRFDFVDFVLGTKDMYNLSDLIEKIENSPIVKTNLSSNIPLYSLSRPTTISANITIIRGCSNYCSYCIVPYVRGKEESRSIKEIINEIKSFIKNGVKEIVLLGQNVNVYGLDINTNLEELLFEINNLNNLLRIRYVTSHPHSVTKKFIQTIKNLDKVCEHIHVPFQSGSNKILKNMNRKYTREEYIEKINMIRSIIPNIGITADVIVGYPNETEKDFEDTLDLINECKLDNIFSFKYSPRKGTASYKLEDNIPRNIKEARLKKLHEVSEAMALEKNNLLINTNQEILWEKDETIRDSHLLSGRTRTFKLVFAPFKKNRIGKLDLVNIEKASPHFLRGNINKEKILNPK